MKYIIKENKLNDLIEKVLKLNFPEIVDIDYGTKRVMLGSETEKYKIGDKIEVTIIKVTVNNINKELKPQDFITMGKDIRSVLKSTLSLDIEEYASLYDIELYAIEKIKKFPY